MTTQVQSEMMADGAVNTTQLATNAVTTAKITDANVTPAKLSQPLTAVAAVATTSGTAINISTSIPSWVQRITVVFRGVSTSGATDLLIQIGSGSFQTTGYVSSSGYIGTASTTNVTTSTAGFNTVFGNTAQIMSGTMTLMHMGSNVWVSSHSGKLATTITVTGGGDVALGGVLDRIRITTTNGTDTFDAGSVSIFYEG